LSKRWGGFDFNWFEEFSIPDERRVVPLDYVFSCILTEADYGAGGVPFLGDGVLNANRRLWSQKRELACRAVFEGIRQFLLLVVEQPLFHWEAELR
jgi:hypothetical protein